MAIIFPDPTGQNPVNTFSPTSTPFDTSTTSNLTYIWDPALQVWTSTAGGGGGGGVTSVGVTSPLTNSGTATAPVIGIPDATTGTKGAVSVGTNLQVTSGAISVPDASDTTKGVSEIATAAEAATGTDATRTLSPATGVPKVLADMTGAAIIPGGDDTERAAITTPTAGMLRYNDQGGTPVAMEYYDGTQWVDLATGGGGNGATLGPWEVVNIAPAFNAKSILYGNGKFLALGGSLTDSASWSGDLQVSVSTDGYTWSAPSTAVAGVGLNGSAGFIFANGNFCFSVPASQTTYTSADGTSWNTGAATGTTIIPRAGGGGSFIATSNANNNVYYSGDGLNWSSTTLPTAGFTPRSVAYGGGTDFLLLALDSSNNINLYKSTNGGSTWVLAVAGYSTSSGNYDGPIHDGTNYLVSTSNGSRVGVFKSTTGVGAASFSRVNGVVPGTQTIYALGSLVLGWNQNPGVGGGYLITSADSFTTGSISTFQPILSTAYASNGSIVVANANAQISGVAVSKIS